MDKIPLQYVTNLDKRYSTKILEIQENIDNFNTYLYNFIQKNYIHPSRNKPINKSDATESDAGEYHKSSDGEQNSLVIFNDMIGLFRTPNDNNIIDDICSRQNKSPLETNDDLPNDDLMSNDLSGNDVSGNDVSGNGVSCNDLSGNDVSGNDLSGNDLSGNDVSGNDVSGNDVSGNDVSGNDVSGNDVSGNDVSGNDLSGNDLSGNDVSGNELSGNDVSGNDLSGNDVSGNDVPDHDLSGNGKSNSKGIENDVSGNNIENDEKSNKKTINIKHYEIPALVFPTKKKIIRKYYNKLIVKLHPDKIETKNAVKFLNYYIECKEAKELNSVYKFWLLTKKIGIKVKKTVNVNKAFLIEINMLKIYLETLENSPINKWINSDNSDEKDQSIITYIKTFL